MLKEAIKQQIYPLIKSRPDFLIIGAQKAGTTSLYQYLVQHPQIVGNKSWKEIRYFDLPENYSRGFSWYLGNFPSKLRKGNRLTFDASPSYLYFDDIPKLIRQDLGNIKMIAILREPASRAYSAWQMYHSFFDNPHESLREIADRRTFLQAIEDEMGGKDAPYPYAYIDRGKYIHQLKNYYGYFDPASLLILDFDQLRKDIFSVLENVCRFLEIEPFPQEAIQKLQKEKYNTGKYRRSDKDDYAIAQLKDYFAPFNEELYQFLGKNYNW
jgi:hypothetical protein